MMARIGCKENDNFKSIIVITIDGKIYFFLYSYNSISLPTSSSLLLIWHTLWLNFFNKLFLTYHLVTLAGTNKEQLKFTVTYTKIKSLSE